jgi:branched-chain amino acid transport system ATP-binding protein
MSGGLLAADSVSKHFGGQKAVDEVSFSLEGGTITGLIGPNGAGKTTLFSCLAGFLKPTSGRILLHDRDIAGLPPYSVFAAGLARTFQIPRLFPEMTVLENVTAAARNQAGERFWNVWFRPTLVRQQELDIREQARYWLQFMGLTDLEHQPANILSGGQRKLLELARAMVSKPEIVLLDEPGAGVNPVLLDRIAEKITALNSTGTTFLIIEHDMDLVASLCHSVMVMAEGRLLASGSPAVVLRDPRVIEAYLGSKQGSQQDTAA